MARQEGESKSGFKETVKRWGLVTVIAGGVIFIVSSSGLALTVAVGGGGAYAGAKFIGKGDEGK
jgi:hypothetical protein